MTAYDPSIIESFAADLYKRAGRIVFSYTFAGAGVGLLPSFLPGAQQTGGILLFVPVLAFFGYIIGANKAFSLKLQAQTALCQVAIERNTRNENGPHYAARSLENIRPISVNDAS